MAKLFRLLAASLLIFGVVAKQNGTVLNQIYRLKRSGNCCVPLCVCTGTCTCQQQPSLQQPQTVSLPDYQLVSQQKPRPICISVCMPSCSMQCIQQQLSLSSSPPPQTFIPIIDQQTTTALTPIIQQTTTTATVGTTVQQTLIPVVQQTYGLLQNTVKICIGLCMPACDPYCIQQTTTQYRPSSTTTTMTSPVYIPTTTTVYVPPSSQPTTTTIYIPAITPATQTQVPIITSGIATCITLCMPTCAPGCIQQYQPLITPTALTTLTPTTTIYETVTYPSITYSTTTYPPTAQTTILPFQQQVICISVCMPQCLSSCVNNIQNYQQLTLSSSVPQQQQAVVQQSLQQTEFYQTGTETAQPLAQQYQTENVIQQQPEMVPCQVTTNNAQCTCPMMFTLCGNQCCSSG